MTNQTPALLVQRAPFYKPVYRRPPSLRKKSREESRAAVMLLQPVYFSRPSLPRAIIPDARPLGTFENQDSRDGKTRYI